MRVEGAFLAAAAGLTQSKSSGIVGGTSAHGGVHGGVLVAVLCEKQSTSKYASSTSTWMSLIGMTGRTALRPATRRSSERELSARRRRRRRASRAPADPVVKHGKF